MDSTSFHVDGAYKQNNLIENETSQSKNEVPPTPIKIVKGYSRDHHPDLNQVVLNLIAENKTGIPLMMKVADGNQIDAKAFASLVDKHIDSLIAMSKSTFVLIGDATLFTKKGLEAIKTKKIEFISRVPHKIKEAKTLLSSDLVDSLTPLDENYSYKEHTITYQDMEQKWVIYKSKLATYKESKTVAKEILKKSTQSTKTAKRLMAQPFFYEEDAKEVLKLFCTKNRTIEISNESLKKKSKFKTKGRPKPNQKPDFYEYYWQFNISMSIEEFKE